MSEATLSLSEIIRKLKPYSIVSVNTSSLFNGDLTLLKKIRKKYPEKFLIRKDFIMIPRQIKESKDAGADAVLLIRDFLTKEQYGKLIDTCEKENVISITEITSAILVDSKVVIVNSRNLNTGDIYPGNAEKVCKDIRKLYKNIIYASGENSDRVIKEGIADAVLIGTAFVKDKLK